MPKFNRIHKNDLFTQVNRSFFYEVCLPEANQEMPFLKSVEKQRRYLAYGCNNEYKKPHQGRGFYWL